MRDPFGFDCGLRHDDSGFRAERDATVGFFDKRLFHGRQSSAEGATAAFRRGGTGLQVKRQAARRRTRARAEAISRDWNGFLRISVTPAASARSESIGPV